VDPFTWEDLEQLPSSLKRKIVSENGKAGIQDLAFAEKNCKPMICLPGIREYHNHPAHTGDPWLLHRGNGGEGSLGFIIDKIYDYGIVPINAYHLQLNISIPTVQLGMDINSISE
jgi:hypothetical protein